MLSKGELKYYSSLLRKKERENEKKFIAEGKRIVEEGLKSNFICEVIICTEMFLEKNRQFLQSHSARIETVNEGDFLKLSDTDNPQGILGVFHQIQSPDKLIPDSGLIVFLENISDPGNAGTILRNCDWFGVTTVIFNNQCVEPYNPKVVRSSMGSLFHLDVHEVSDTLQILREMKDRRYKIICADLDGQNLYDFQPDNKSALILSSEAFGPSSDVLNLSEIILSIPQKGKAESLNVASASAVILAHLTK